jgi:hypothetical protein
MQSLTTLALTVSCPEWSDRYRNLRDPKMARRHELSPHITYIDRIGITVRFEWAPPIEVSDASPIEKILRRRDAPGCWRGPILNFILLERGGH